MGVKRFIICSNHKGFLLTETVAAMALVTLMMLFFAPRIVDLCRGWRRMQLDGELLDAGQYMLAKLEREISLNAKEILVDNNELRIETIAGARSLVIWNNTAVKGLYQDTTTNTGTGTNPLFIRDCLVSNWHTERRSDREIYVSFTLQKNQRSLNFCRLLYCVNGRVGNE